MNKNLKKLKGIMRVVFGRTTFIVVSLLAQFVIFVASIVWLTDYSSIVYTGLVLLGAVTVIHILNEDVNSSFKMAWMIPVLLIPVFGTMAYLLVNMQLGTKVLKHRLEETEAELIPEIYQNQEVLSALGSESEGEKGIANYLYHVAHLPVYQNNEVEYFPLGEDKFQEMINQIRSAKEFIFMEYFIVAEGFMWNTILDLLKQKVEEGVEVRFMYDGMCSLALLPYGYYKDLEKYGIKCRPFSQIKPVLSTYQNNRDHRKILIIDGVTAFTGGVNLSDEYINRVERFGHWKDTAIMVKGDAVKSFTLMFLKMWNVAEKKPQHLKQDEIRRYIKYPVTKELIQTEDEYQRPLHKGGYVIPYCDSPFDGENIGKQVYIDILNRAQHYVHIMTPYLILDDEMVAALTFCAKRGVETIIIMPHIPDKIYAYLLARTYYMELIEHGVKIYEYTPGFVHAKVFVSDDIKASVGTINLDYRSLYLHFECAAYVYKNEVVREIEKDYQNTLSMCQEITKESYYRYSKVKMLIGKILRLFAPLM